MSTIGGPNVVDPGLVLQLDAANTKSYISGSITANNLISTLTPGTLINGPTFNTGSGGSIVFDGVNDYVTWGDNFDLTATNISGFVWGWANSLNANLPWIDKLAGNGNYRLHCNSDGSVNFGIRNTANTFQQMATPPGTITTNSWNNIGFTFNNSTREGKIYINGQLLLSNTFTIDRGDTSVALQTGFQANNLGTLNGRIATLSLYNKELTANEVLQNYNALKSRFGL